MQDATPAAEPVLPLLAVFPVPAPAPPTEPPTTGGGPRPRAVATDGVASAPIAAAVAGPPTPVPPGTEIPAEKPGAASAPKAVGVADATDAPPPAASASPADSAPSSAVSAPAADSASSPAGPALAADSAPPSAASAPTADSAPPQPVAPPVHAAPARPAEGFHPAGHTAPRPAAEQVASVLVQVADGPAGGGQRMVVRLDPAELGKVEVRVERAEGGPAQVSLTVDRPETLLLLLRDQPGLHRALDQAGVPAEGRALHFQLAPAAPDAASADRGATPGWGGAADGGRGDGTWHGQGHGGQPGGRHRGHAPADAAGHGTYRAWRDAGLDITA